MSSVLKILGGESAVGKNVPEELFAWPYVNKEIEDAVLDVVRRNVMSDNDITQKFEKEFAKWQQRKYAVAYCNGTLSLQAAMFAVGLGAGDELICPTKTYWASCMSAASLGASVVFANVKRDTLCLDPDDLERCLSPKTKAIMVVHYAGYPAEMDKICAFAKKHGLKVIEDVSHAQGGRYKGQMVGTFGDVAAMSLMSGKSFATGEMGIMVTDNVEMYERGLAYSHYERNNEKFIGETEYLKEFYHLPLGGMKGRVNQICPAIGLIRLKDYDEKTAEVRKAMNYFLDKMEGVKGFRAIRVDEKDGSTMAGWYMPQAMYVAEELGGLPIELYLKAVEAETGFLGSEGANYPLHTHTYFRNFDLFQTGTPTRIQFAERDVRELDDALAPSENIPCFSIPWFKKFIPEVIDQYVEGYKKVSEHYEEILANCQKEDGVGGRWYGFNN